jgi:hypothetical protein
LLISFREAADLSFQIVIAVTVVVCGTALATVTAKGKQKPRQLIDVSRPVLWEAGPVRIDRQEQLLTITVRKPATTDGKAANSLCSDAIGLRIACDLVAVDRRPS